MEYTIVLSDELLKAYYDFKESKSIEQDTITKLFKYYISGHLTNCKQLERIGVEDDALKQQLANEGYIKQTLEELCEETTYKFILNTEKEDYPYINIHSDRIERNFTATYGKKESRGKTIKHIKALCKDARFIFIYDKHMNDKVIREIAKILPRKKLNIIYKGGQLSQNQTTLLKREYNEWIIKPDRENTYTDYHDRYLLIDNKIEIILTSGFDYLFDENKEFTYIVRKK
ncbi:hypothetical protein [Candidatus Parabeggiatoa sp. HSG14]|uniref:hypothetical protein n=1 Tax=Candidatus Parabeggiatoa sp. HSG14 TaxID=3055593 RepID=UPI0025A92898|nr:hypothetical protein [Thiotrichales bacterium HSG14]